MPRRWSLPVLVLAALTVVAAALTPSAPASAADCKRAIKLPGGGVGYVDCKPGSTEPGTSPSPSPGDGVPSCNLVAPATFCEGDRACHYEVWGPPWAYPPGVKPSPTAEPRLKVCVGPTGSGTEPVWFDPANPAPSLFVQAQQAVGALRPPVVRLRFSPEGRAVVGVATWLWADVAGGDLTGSSAFGLVATATPDHLEVDPGDGTGVRSCPWVTTARAAAEACTHTYVKASVAGPEKVGRQPAYRATAQAVWVLRFEDGGVPVTIPGAPAEVRSPLTVTPIPVAEVQAEVVP